MPFTVQHFLESAAQTKKIEPRQPCWSHRDDGCLGQSSMLPSSLGSSLSKGMGRHADCHRSCRHVSCRTFRPTHNVQLSDTEDQRIPCFNYDLGVRIFSLHKKLQVIQSSTDASQKLINIALSENFGIDRAILRKYVQQSRRCIKMFENLLTNIREENAYFGHIDISNEHMPFLTAASTSGLSEESISQEQLDRWWVEAEAMEEYFETPSERIFRVQDYAKLQPVFTLDWNFERAYTRGGGSAEHEEEVAPDDMVLYSCGA